MGTSISLFTSTSTIRTILIITASTKSKETKDVKEAKEVKKRKEVKVHNSEPFWAATATYMSMR
jgi:hypothetical protein